MNKILLLIEKKLNYKTNYDVDKRVINNDCVIYYLSSLVDFSYVNKLIEGKILKKDSILNGAISTYNKFDDLINAIFSGCLLLIENDEFYILETRNYPNRSISESESEKSLKGSHDGFGESILTNTALIRRRIKDINYKCELLTIGNKSKTDVIINYMDDKVNHKLLSVIKRKINSLDIDSLVLADKSLTELLFNQKYQIFPKVRYTERPDIASIHILKGYIVILVDTSSSCIIVPTTFFELNEQLQEYHLPSIISTFSRIFRFFCVLIGLFLLPLWFLLSINKYSPDETILIVTDISKMELFIQIISIQIFLSAIRLASINTSSLFSSSMSLFASIIISGLAVETGLLKAEVVFYAALSSICCFAISNYETSRAISFWNLLLIIAVGLFDKIGFIIACIILFISVVTIKFESVHYLYPFIPFNFKALMKRIFKFPFDSSKDKNL